MPVADEEPWGTDFMGGFDATYLRDRCAQSSLAFPVISGSEDCLHVSVYTPMVRPMTRWEQKCFTQLYIVKCYYVLS